MSKIDSTGLLTYGPYLILFTHTLDCCRVVKAVSSAHACAPAKLVSARTVHNANLDAWCRYLYYCGAPIGESDVPIALDYRIISYKKIWSCVSLK